MKNSNYDEFFKKIHSKVTRFHAEKGCRPVNHGVMIELFNGAKITVYYNRTILVQGTVRVAVYNQRVGYLKKVLPPDTIWKIQPKY